MNEWLVGDEVWSDEKVVATLNQADSKIEAE